MNLKKFSAILAGVVVTTMFFSNGVSARTISNTLKVTYTVTKSTAVTLDEFKTNFLSAIRNSTNETAMRGVLDQCVGQLEKAEAAVKTAIINDINTNFSGTPSLDLFNRVIPDYKSLSDARKLDVAAAVLKVKEAPYYNILDIFSKYVKISCDTVAMINSFNSATTDGVKTAVETFNARIRSLASEELNTLQTAIDQQLLGNTVNLTSLVDDYVKLSSDERLAAAQKIVNSRTSMGGQFYGFYEGSNAFLPSYASAVNTLKAINGNLINLTWDGTNTEDQTVNVVQGQTITISFKAKTADRDLIVTGVRYIATWKNGNIPVTSEILDGVDVNGSKEVVSAHSVSDEETQDISFIFKQPGIYTVSIEAVKE